MAFDGKQYHHKLERCSKGYASNILKSGLNDEHRLWNLINRKGVAVHDFAKELSNHPEMT